MKKNVWDISQDHLLDKLRGTHLSYFTSSTLSEVYTNHYIDITWVYAENYPNTKVLVVFENIKIEIINNNNILMTWYQNNPANLLCFPG